MRNTSAAADIRGEAARAFEGTADAIMYRWSVERDPWVSASEFDQARAYLERAGIDVTGLPMTRRSDETADTLEAARVVLLGLRHLHAVRRRTRG
jgi:hypothetical protein